MLWEAAVGCLKGAAEILWPDVFTAWQRCERSVHCAGSSLGGEEDAGAVVMRMQYMTAADMKWTMSFLRVAEIIAAVLLALIMVAKVQNKDKYLTNRYQLKIAQTAVFSGMWLLLLAFLAVFAVRILCTHRRGPELESCLCPACLSGAPHSWCPASFVSLQSMVWSM